MFMLHINNDIDLATIVISTGLYLGPSSQVCRPAVRYRRNHGAPHWLLSHQCCEDTLLHRQNYCCPQKISGIFQTPMQF